MVYADGSPNANELFEHALRNGMREWYYFICGSRIHSSETAAIAVVVVVVIIYPRLFIC